MNRLEIVMRRVMLAGGFVLALVLSVPAAAQGATVVAGDAPGKVGAARNITLTATITAIDAATRTITLRSEKGDEAVVTAGPEVRNFAQLKVGDRVNADYLEALVVELKKGGGLVVSRTEQAGAARAAPGQSPGAGAAREVTIVADVIGVDAKTQSVKLRGPNRTVDVKVGDPERFKQIAVGDQVQATYTQAVALSVEPAAAK